MVGSQALFASDGERGIPLWAPAGIVVLIAFLVWGTGLATDDYVHILDGLSWHLAEHWWPKEYASIPVLHYTQGLVFYALGYRPWAYDVVKVVYASFAVYAATSFFALFCSPRRALLLGFLFVFFPLHDAADYSLTEFYLIESFSFYLLAYALGAGGRFRLAIVFALLASFASYGSSPIAIGLALLAYFEGRRKLALALLVPNLIYVVYYLASSLIFHIGTPRLIGEMTITALARGFLLETVTFIDAAVGPSAWAKFYYSVRSLDLLGLAVAVIVTAAAIYFIRSEQRRPATKALVLTAAVMVVLSFGMFTLTGLYPHIAFNLGDRIMIYGGFLLICAFAALPVPKPVEVALVAIAVLAIVGVSQHWKRWDSDVTQVASNIKSNAGLLALPAGTQVFVSHHQYSRLGPFSHIELFTATYVVKAFFGLEFAGHGPLNVASFNRRLVFENGALRDRKFGDATPVGSSIWLYNSRTNVLERVEAADIQKTIDALPDENRHWTQLLDSGWIKSLVDRLAPRLSYAY